MSLPPDLASRGAAAQPMALLLLDRSLDLATPASHADHPWDIMLAVMAAAAAADAHGGPASASGQHGQQGQGWAVPVGGAGRAAGVVSSSSTPGCVSWRCGPWAKLLCVCACVCVRAHACVRATDRRSLARGWMRPTQPLARSLCS